MNPRSLYEILLNYGNDDTKIREILIGLTWTYCHGDGIGLCMSPAIPTRTLPWSGTLAGKAIADLAPWVNSWNAYEATIGLAAINSVINGKSRLIPRATPIGSGNLAVFEHFLPFVRGEKVAVIGRYPDLGRYETEMELTVIERQPGDRDLPDPAAEYVLPEADWVFLTATSIANKTFPRLLELSRDAKVVLMGPTVPWLEEFADMGIDYLAGVAITDSIALKQTIAEGGGVRIFQTGVEYRVLAF